MPTLLTLICLVDGHSPSSAFAVEIDSAQSTIELRDLIKAAKPKDFRRIDANNLSLWKVALADDDDNDAPVLLDQVSDKSKLRVTSTMSKVFSADLLEDTIHILVQRPSEPSTGLGRSEESTEFMVTVKGITITTTKWRTVPNTATLDRLRQAIWEQNPSLRARSQSLVYEYKGLQGYFVTDEDLRAVLRTLIQQGITNLTLRLEDPPKSFLEVTSDDLFRLYGHSIHGFDPVEEVQHPPFTPTKYSKALDSALTMLATVVESTEPGIIIQNAVTLFPDLQLTIGKDVVGRRAFGRLDYGIGSKAYPDLMIPVTTFPHREFSTGLAINALQLDTVSSNRKQRRTKDGEDNNCGANNPASAAVTSFGIVTDSYDWYLQKCTIDKLDDSGFNFPKFHSSKIPTRVNLAAPDNEWRAAVREVFKYVVSHISRMQDGIPQSKRIKLDK
ncbi:hypothetical protein DFQ27_007629 [Actinomortierella ambigua]|uniref:Crinkler effector protein N-terminal domain-containing protein n=1 Tax=Actinomortierella ambigua TaxID=1343610 RepID=A0A9P6PUS0_9FUNG|nr:hypothetical protein DFQ27_007629 [Actinomortierella ambigua]